MSFSNSYIQTTEQEELFRVLLIEDNPGDVRLVKELLRDSHHIELLTADCLEKGLEMIRQNEFHACLLDLGLPESQDLETLSQVHQNASRLPVIVLTGLDDDRKALAAVRSGAQDYLSKNMLSPEILRRAIRHAVERERIEQMLRDREHELATIYSNAPIVLLLVDQACRVRKINAAGAKAAAQTADQLQGLYVCFALCCLNSINYTCDPSSIPECAHCQVHASVIQTIETEQPIHQIEVTIPVHKADEDRNLTYLLSTSRLIVQDEPLVLLALLDITERKKAEQNLTISYQKLEQTFERTIQAITAISEMRDPYTHGHQRKVAQISCAIARQMKLSDEEVKTIHYSALLHDIGKIQVPAEILSKPSKLNEWEWGIIRTHVTASHKILSTIEFPWPVADIVIQHHERLDGSGYPFNLTGDQICLAARILAVSDVVESMDSHRPYREAKGREAALNEITKNSGFLYDPIVVEACLTIYKNGFSVTTEA